MRSMTIRQFNATYPLQVKRSQMPRSRRGGRPAGSRRAADRERVRAVLLDLAREVAAADDKGRLVEVVGGMDRWVDRVLGMGTRQRAEVPAAEIPSTDGGGPTGLMLAGERALAGTDVVILERRADQEVTGLRARGTASGMR